jgi:hypothetical protein
VVVLWVRVLEEGTVSCEEACMGRTRGGTFGDEMVQQTALLSSGGAHMAQTEAVRPAPSKHAFSAALVFFERPTG